MLNLIYLVKFLPNQFSENNLFQFTFPQSNSTFVETTRILGSRIGLSNIDLFSIYIITNLVFLKLLFNIIRNFQKN